MGFQIGIYAFGERDALGLFQLPIPPFLALIFQWVNPGAYALAVIDTGVARFFQRDFTIRPQSNITSLAVYRHA